MATPRAPMTPQERAFLEVLRRLWPNGAGYRLGGAEDREVEGAVSRLIESGVVERVEQIGTDMETGLLVDAAVYELTEDFLADIGGTRRPEDN